MIVDSRIELVLFKRFLVRLSNALSEDNNYLGVVNGDSVAQVASQTVENIYVTDKVAKIPVFRPLVAFNKQEIINIAQKIGTFQTSLEPYKDCCSLVSASNPRTKVPSRIAEQAEEKMDIDDVVRKSLEKITIVDI
jgi:thiamine biosynthesis protein ThiI